MAELFGILSAVVLVTLVHQGNCVSPYGSFESNLCPQGTFSCGGGCIDEQLVCNGINDCPNYEDEDVQLCYGWFFQSTPTLPPELPKCKPTEFACPDGFCLAGSRRCDGDQNCLRGRWDEEGCDRITRIPADLKTIEGCHYDEFPCGDGSCRPTTRYCDGRPDCLDGRDEPAGCSQNHLVAVNRDFSELNENAESSEWDEY